MRRLIGLVLLSALVSGTQAGAMSYGLLPFEDGSAALVAQGQIGRDEAERFAAALQAARARGAVPRTLLISSPGGHLDSALELGQALRRLGMQTVVGSVAQAPDGQRGLAAGGCHSACVMVLMAGVGRSVLPGSRVGVHSPQVVVVAGGQGYRLDDTTNRFLVQRSEPMLRSYARAMGVSPTLIDVAHGVPHSSLRTLTSSEMSRFRLVTSGPGRTTGRKAASRRAAKRPTRG
ncbi:MAG TPA: hypothetical protein VHL98_07025 [Microvirga sp.]|jgi:hypothetical protein|nr:hypothetical protein [Microvirga sp.]